MLVDPMTHRVVDLLPDRSASSVEAWLTPHPTLTVICRDRSDLYAAGIRRGAPHAGQVVDRCHLVHNLHQALEAARLDHQPALQAAAVGTPLALTPAESPVPVMPRYRGRRRSPKPAPGEEAAPPPRQARWVAVYEAVHALLAQGTPVSVIARRLGISRPTVDADRRREPPPGRKQPQWRPSARVLTPCVPYPIRRWRESGADSIQLWHAMQALGDSHAARTVGRVMTQLRRAAEAGQPLEPQGCPYTRPQGPSARAVSFALVCPAAQRSEAVQRELDQRCHVEPPIARAYTLSQAFLTLVRERRGEALEAWMAEAIDPGVAALARFARGLHDDLRAIIVGLPLAWSNGVTEGQIHRLKLLKRQSYGRAGMALLRQRILQAASGWRRAHRTRRSATLLCWDG
jgi:transposase